MIFIKSKHCGRIQGKSRFEIDRCDFLLSVDDFKSGFFQRMSCRKLKQVSIFFVPPFVVVGQQRPFNPQGFIVQFSLCRELDLK